MVTNLRGVRHRSGVKLGNALAALKHSIPGDLNLSTREEVENLLKKGGLRISR